MAQPAFFSKNHTCGWFNPLASALQAPESHTGSGPPGAARLPTHPWHGWKVDTPARIWYARQQAKLLGIACRFVWPHEPPCHTAKGQIPMGTGASRSSIEGFRNPPHFGLAQQTEARYSLGGQVHQHTEPHCCCRAWQKPQRLETLTSQIGRMLKSKSAGCWRTRRPRELFFQKHPAQTDQPDGLASSGQANCVNPSWAQAWRLQIWSLHWQISSPNHVNRMTWDFWARNFHERFSINSDACSCPLMKEAPNMSKQFRMLPCPTTLPAGVAAALRQLAFQLPKFTARNLRIWLDAKLLISISAPWVGVLGPTYVLGRRGAKRPCEYLRPPRRNIVVKYAFWSSPCSLNQGLLWGCSVLWRAMVLDCVAGSFQVGLRLVNLAIQSILEVKWLRLDNGCCCMVSPCLGSCRHVTIQSLYIECWKATPKCLLTPNKLPAFRPTSGV